MTRVTRAQARESIPSYYPASRRRSVSRAEPSITAKRDEHLDFQHAALHQRKRADNRAGFIDGSSFNQRHRAEPIFAAPDAAHDALNVELANSFRFRLEQRCELLVRKRFGAAAKDR